MKTKKVAIAISGGVDSSIASALLVKEGYDVTAFHMQLWHEKTKDEFKNKCCDLASLEAARKVASKLEIPFFTVDFSTIFKREIVDYFLKEYSLGNTPNPCIYCNKLIKFGELFDYIRGLGFDLLATGHYARIKKNKIYHLLSGKDKKKDQSYFLYNLAQEKLAHILFPVGELEKKEVFALAKKFSLPVANRPESQEVCFLPENDYRLFLKRQIGEKIIPGKVLDTKGEAIGAHSGLPLYTIGQRHGFKINRKKADGKGIIPPFYVIEKNSEKNALIVGFGEETEREKFKVKKVNLINNPFDSSLKEVSLRTRIRHQGAFLDSKIKLLAKRTIEVSLKNPQRGVSPGQAAVFYKGEEVLGGGIICSR